MTKFTVIRFRSIDVVCEAAKLKLMINSLLTGAPINSGKVTGVGAK